MSLSDKKEETVVELNELEEDQGHATKPHHEHVLISYTAQPTSSLPNVSNISKESEYTHVANSKYFDDSNHKLLKAVKLGMDLQYAEHKKKKKNLLEKKYIWVLLTIASIFGAVIAWVHDLILKYMYQGRITIIEQIDSSLFGVRLLVWIIYNLFFIIITLLMVVLIAPTAEGSGVSHIKAVLNGADLKDVMSLQTFFVKLLTVALVVGSQMVLGKMGPTVHICTIFILYMLKLKIFKPIEKSKRLRQQLILCGVSIGVGAAFATPCGAVLFAIELVGGYYSMRTYFKAFYVATVSSLVSRALYSIVTLNMEFESYWDIQILNPSFTSIELVLFILLGVFIGVMGIVFVQINIFLMTLKDKYGNLVLWSNFTSNLSKKYSILKMFENKVLLTIFFSIVTSVLSYPDLLGKFSSLSYGGIFKDLMSTKPLSAENNWITNSTVDVFQSLFVALIVKFFLIIFTIILPIPGGSFNGIVLLGAIVGRVIGEILNLVIPYGFPYLFGIYEVEKQLLIQPGAYAFVGGVASVACVTQSYSSVIIFLEMAGGGAHIPSLIASVIAISITKYFSLGMYNIVINLRGWNAMLEQQTDSDEMKLVSIMKTFDEMEVILEEEVSFDFIEIIIEKLKSSQLVNIPIINNRKEMILLGKVTSNSLIEQYNIRKAIEEKNEQLNEVNRQERIMNIDYKSCDVVLGESNDVHTAHQILYQNNHLDELYVCWKGKLLGVVERKAVKGAILSKNRKKELDIYHLY